MSSGPRIRVAVLYGGRSSEHDISVESGRSVVAALDRERYDVVEIEIDRSGTWQLDGRLTSRASRSRSPPARPAR